MADPRIMKIFELYEDYIRWSAEFLDDYGGLKMFSQLFNGGADYKLRPEHGEFLRSVEAASADYLSALRSGEADRSGLVGLMNYVQRQCYGLCDDWAAWTLLAAEKSALPLVEFLTAEEATALCREYKKQRRRNLGLQPQQDMLKALKNRSR